MALLAVGVLLASCTAAPQEEKVLSDGEHTGYVRALDHDGLELDVAQMLTGDEAEAAAIEDGELNDPAGGLPNDFYIRNTDAATVRVPLAADVELWLIDATTVEPREVGRSELSRWLASEAELEWAYASHEHWFATVEVADGQVVRVAEVYLP